MASLFGLARLGRDAELRYTPQNDAVLNVSLAFNYGKKGDDGKRPTQWVDGSMWGKRAEAIAEYLSKGSAVAVLLSDVHIETFQRADGSPGSKMVGRIEQIDLAGGGERADGTTARPAQTHGQQRAAAKTATAPPANTSLADMDDDIPF